MGSVRGLPCSSYGDSVNTLLLPSKSPEEVVEHRVLGVAQLCPSSIVLHKSIGVVGAFLKLLPGSPALWRHAGLGHSRIANALREREGLQPVASPTDRTEGGKEEECHAELQACRPGKDVPRQSRVWPLSAPCGCINMATACVCTQHAVRHQGHMWHATTHFNDGDT